MIHIFTKKNLISICDLKRNGSIANIYNDLVQVVMHSVQPYLRINTFIVINMFTMKPIIRTCLCNAE